MKTIDAGDYFAFEAILRSEGLNLDAIEAIWNSRPRSATTFNVETLRQNARKTLALFPEKRATSERS